MIKAKVRNPILAAFLSVPMLLCASGNGDSALIRRDAYGVPHILAANEYQAAVAHGFAAAEDHFEVLARLFLRARAEQAAFLGPNALEEDELIVRLRIREIAAERFDRLPPATVALLNGYAEGYNLYLAAHKDKAPQWATPVSGVDVLAHCRAVLLLDFSSVDRSPWRRAPQPGSSAPASSMWAIGRGLSASGHGLLLANPHLPWGGAHTFHEVHITVPERINVSGATLLGFPVVGIGFNEKLGWSHTVNNRRADDLYQLSFDPKDRSRYLYDGMSLPISRKTFSLRVKRGSQVDIVTREADWTHYGPVVYGADGNAVSVRSPNIDAVDFITQWNRMAKSRSLAEFRAVLNMQSLPMFNIGYADQDGEVFYLFNGRIPSRVREFGDAGPKPGNTSDSEWYSLLPVADLPHIVNPKGGYIQNCNDGPWWANLREPIDPGLFPGDLTRDMLGFRGQFSLQYLDRASKLDLDQIQRIKFDETVLVAPRVKAGLIAAAEGRADQSPEWKHAIDVLKAWDNKASAVSRGGVLFVRWWSNYTRAVKKPFETSWSPKDPLATPRGIGDPGAAVAALAKTIEELRTSFGDVDVPWGQVFRFRRGSLDLPVGGDPNAFRTIAYRPDRDGKMAAVYGDSYILAVEFERKPVAYSVLAYSQSSDPRSPHYLDQSELFTKGRLKRVWFVEQDVLANVKRSYTPAAAVAARASQWPQ